ncbi:MAG: hypothetical protein JXR07_14585 [Reichenbachiella sp.]
MKKSSILRISYYIIFGLVVASFYIGLRSEEYKVEYTILALVFWGAAFLVNKWEKKERQNEKS